MGRLLSRRLPIVVVPWGPVPDLDQHPQTGPGMEPGYYPRPLFPWWDGAYLLDTRRQGLFGKGMDIRSVGAGVVVDSAQSSPLGHQPGGAAVVGRRNADLYY